MLLASLDSFMAMSMQSRRCLHAVMESLPGPLSVDNARGLSLNF